MAALTILVGLPSICAPASGGSGRASASASSSPIPSASPVPSTTSSTSLADGGYLSGLVLGREGREGLVQRGGGDVDLLGGLEHLVRCLKNFFIRLSRERFVTYVSPYAHRQLHGPDRQGSSGATATL